MAADAEVHGIQVNIGAGSGTTLNDILDMIERVRGARRRSRSVAASFGKTSDASAPPGAAAIGAMAGAHYLADALAIVARG
mgnify:CR=1 FL=1